jgi:hypothetical protein
MSLVAKTSFAQTEATEAKYISVSAEAIQIDVVKESDVSTIVTLKTDDKTYINAKFPVKYNDIIGLINLLNFQISWAAEHNIEIKINSNAVSDAQQSGKYVDEQTEALAKVFLTAPTKEGYSFTNSFPWNAKPGQIWFIDNETYSLKKTKKGLNLEVNGKVKVDLPMDQDEVDENFDETSWFMQNSFSKPGDFHFIDLSKYVVSDDGISMSLISNSVNPNWLNRKSASKKK